MRLSSLCPALLLIAAGCGDPEAWGEPRPSPFEMSDVALKTQVLADGLTIPFDVAVVSDDDFFVTDRVGKLYRFTGGGSRRSRACPR